jgi:hypothetical protein
VLEAIGPVGLAGEVDLEITLPGAREVLEILTRIVLQHPMLAHWYGLVAGHGNLISG